MEKIKNTFSVKLISSIPITYRFHDLYKQMVDRHGSYYASDRKNYILNI